jgi:hypothetical protein
MLDIDTIYMYTGSGGNAFGSVVTGRKKRPVCRDYQVPVNDDPTSRRRHLAHCRATLQ